MKKIIEEISVRYYSKLAPNEKYTINSLAELGFPDFLCEAIQIKIHKKINAQLTFPSDEWVNNKAGQVQQVKQQLLKALYHEACLSTEQAEMVIKDAVTDILNVLVQPRKSIPEYIFGKQTTRSKETVEQKISNLTVYHHFSGVLVSYLHRKGKTALTKEQCQTIIDSVDETLTNNYSPDQWTKLLEPLFILTDGQVDPHLLSLFFEDKDMAQKAAAVQQVDKPINQQTFAKILALEESDKIKSAQQVTSRDEDLQESKKSSAHAPPVAKEDSNTQETEVTELKQEKSETGKTNRVHSKYTSHEKSTKKQSLNDVFATQVPDQEKKINKQTDAVSSSSDNDSENKEVPIWKRFTDNNKVKNADKDKTGEQKTGDLPKNKITNNKAAQLKAQLSAKEQLYIDELFNSSKSDYEKNISKIAGKKNWEKVVDTIKNDIFKEYDVNIYSPAAIDFTDQLQNYFSKENR